MLFPTKPHYGRPFPALTIRRGILYFIHLEGNLREYVGRQLGGLSYVRHRDREFTLKEVSIADLSARVEELREKIPAVITSLSRKQLEADYPSEVLGRIVSTQKFLIHLYGHLNWHLGQIDYLRRIVTGAVESARL